MPRVKILVADDDRFFRELMSSWLQLQGWDVAVAENGEAALRRFGAESFDLVLADVVMPGLDGLSLTQEIRRRTPEQEVLLVTQRQDAEAVVAALRAGASDYLLKPIAEEELIERVSRAIERAALRRERARLLTENLEFLRSQALYQRCLSMLSTLDLERLQEGSLSDICGVCDAQSGALWVMEGSVLELRAYRGLLNHEELPERIDPSLEPYGALLASERIFELPGARLGSRFFLPLRSGGELIGLVACADRLTGEFSSEDLAVARAVADFAATALFNARRFAAIERLGLRDSESSAYHLPYFLDYAGKEFYKARRYGRVCSLITLQLELPPERPAAPPALLASMVEALSSLVRGSDMIARAADGELYALLPETDYLGALLFARRTRAALEQAIAKQDARGVALSLGAATFPRDGSDFPSLLAVCRRRREESRASLVRKLDLSRLDFWSAVELLVGDKKSPALPIDDLAGPSRRGLLPPSLFAQLQDELGLEIARDPRARGLLYIGCGEISSQSPAVAAMGRMPADAAMRVYLLGKRADLQTHPVLTPVFLDADERIARHQFVLLYAEDAAYALVQRPTARGAPWGFHSSDPVLVDLLVDKLQACYDLQPL